MLEDRADGLGGSTTDDLRAGRVCRVRGCLQGVVDAAHAADVRRQCDSRDHPGRRRDRRRAGGLGRCRCRGTGRRGAGDGQPGGWVRRDGPDARDVPWSTGGCSLGGRRVIPVWAQVVYLVAAVCFVLALKGLSSPRSARRGNQLGVVGAVLAVVVTFVVEDVENLAWILAAIAIGAVVGVVFARRVAMTAMPQLVALFNGVGGGAAALVALLELSETAPTTSSLAAVAFSVLIGAVSFAGSAVTFAKLQELMTTRPVTLRGGQYVSFAVLAAGIGLAVGVVASGDLPLAVLLTLIGLAFGVLLVLPVGGADVPIVISLLNAFTGLAVAAGGYVLDNTLLIVAGTLVGASGTILTRLMAQAMGRSVTSILFGAFRGGSTAGGGMTGAEP